MLAIAKKILKRPRTNLRWLLDALLKIGKILSGNGECCLQGLKRSLDTSLSVPCDGL